MVDAVVDPSVHDRDDACETVVCGKTSEFAPADK